MTVEDGRTNVFRVGPMVVVAIGVVAAILMFGVPSSGLLFLDNFVAGEPYAVFAALSFTTILAALAYFWRK